MPLGGSAIEFETPRELANRLKLGREEFCQRLLTTLILHAPYPKWNTRSQPSPAGRDFLHRLWDLSAFEDWPGDDLIFIDEFELAPRTPAEQGAAPDYAVLWDDRVWIIELKTEAASHRPEQIPRYFELAHYHHPEAPIDLTYLTPDFAYAFTPSEDLDRYARVSWDDVAPTIGEIWETPQAPGQREVVRGLIDALQRLESEAPSAYLNSLRDTVARPDSAPDPFAAAVATAQATGKDGEQRALDYAPADLELLLELRVQVRERVAGAPADSPLRRVMPWLWRHESGGQPLTGAGQSLGRELRFSRYTRELY